MKNQNTEEYKQLRALRKKQIYEQEKNVELREKQNQYLLSTYGITLEEKLERLKRNSDRCEICDGKVNPNTTVGKFKKKLRTSVVDHCHKTGKVRGILCLQCNAALGLLKENPKIASAAAEYLLHHQPPKNYSDLNQMGFPGWGRCGIKHAKQSKPRLPTLEDFIRQTPLD